MVKGNNKDSQWIIQRSELIQHSLLDINQCTHTASPPPCSWTWKQTVHTVHAPVSLPLGLPHSFSSPSMQLSIIKFHISLCMPILPEDFSIWHAYFRSFSYSSPSEMHQESGHISPLCILSRSANNKTASLPTSGTEGDRQSGNSAKSQLVKLATVITFNQ